MSHRSRLLIFLCLTCFSLAANSGKNPVSAQLAPHPPSLEVAQATESPNPIVESSQKPKKTKPVKSRSPGLLFWIILTLLTFTLVGGAFFYLQLRLSRTSWEEEAEEDLEPEEESAALDENGFHPPNGNLHSYQLPENPPVNNLPLPEPENQLNGSNPFSFPIPEAVAEPPEVTPPPVAPPPPEVTPPSNTELLAVEETTRLPKINIVDELMTELQAQDPAKRRKAIWELAQRGDSRAVQPLVELMIDSDSQQRSLILEALSQITTRTLKPMNRALSVSLQDENAEVRKNAIRDLTRIYELIAQTSQMLRYVADDPDAEVRETAKWALTQLNRLRPPAGMDSLPRPNASDSDSNN